MSSGAKKTILVNPDFFSSKRKNRGKPKQNKKKVPKDIQINTNALKRKLINKIREHQKEKNKQNSTEKNYPKNDGLIKNMSNAEKQEQIYFNDEFNNSIDIDNIDKFQSNNLINRLFLLGTDKFGRDVLSRLVVGARISFFIGFISVLISLIIGVFLGSLSGYYSGNIDRLVMWVINVTWSIPTLLLVIAITLALGKGLWQVFIAVGLTMWVDVARVVRGQVMIIKERQFITAARVLGFSDLRILVKHILPNIVSPLIIISAANFAASILIESGLSFLGLGAQPPMASWGSIIKDHYNYIILGKPMLALIPGICIMSLVMAFMLLGNKLRDKLDVKN